MQDKNYQIILDKSHLLSIFAGQKQLQPFRCQPFLEIQVPFNQYVEFCRDMVVSEYRWLNETVGAYKRALREYDSGNPQRLYRYYYLDMSKAALNELVIALANDKEATIIFHAVDDCDTTISLTNVRDGFEMVTADSVQKVYPEISGRVLNYVNPRSMSKHNRSVFEYIILLQALSCIDEPQTFSIRR